MSAIDKEFAMTQAKIQEHEDLVIYSVQGIREALLELGRRCSINEKESDFKVEVKQRKNVRLQTSLRDLASTKRDMEKTLKQAGAAIKKEQEMNEELELLKQENNLLYRQVVNLKAKLRA